MEGCLCRWVLYEMDGCVSVCVTGRGDDAQATEEGLGLRAIPLCEFVSYFPFY